MFSPSSRLLVAGVAAHPGARHVAIICDGNRRWATTHGLSLAQGYAAAADTVRGRLRDAVELGLEQLTVFAFSTENWARPDAEVRTLVTVIARSLREAARELQREHVRVRFIGRAQGLPPELLDRMRAIEALTAANLGTRLFVAFNYGGRAEILDAARSFRGSTEQEFREFLYAPEMRDPDVIIRTGGERRLSNYVLWQAAYSELVFRDELWPDFTSTCFAESLAEFASRHRRFGRRAMRGDQELAAGAGVRPLVA
jgi:undecaprenyl diphosphate synthase